jgi:hypothetical protein
MVEFGIADCLNSFFTNMAGVDAIVVTLVEVVVAV